MPTQRQTRFPVSPQRLTVSESTIKSNPIPAVDWMDLDSPCRPTSASETMTPQPPTPSETAACTHRRRRKPRTEGRTAAALRFSYAGLASCSAPPRWRPFWVFVSSASSFWPRQGFVPSWVGTLTTLLQSLLLLGTSFCISTLNSAYNSFVFYWVWFIYSSCFGFCENFPSGDFNADIISYVSLANSHRWNSIVLCCKEQYNLDWFFLVFCLHPSGVATRYLSTLGNETLFWSNLLLTTHPVVGLMRYMWYGVRVIRLHGLWKPILERLCFPSLRQLTNPTLSLT